MENGLIVENSEEGIYNGMRKAFENLNISTNIQKA
jgi:hypothetical protein